MKLKQQKTMKKSIFILALSNFVAGMLGTSCKSDTEIEANADHPVVTQEAIELAKEEEMLDEMKAKNIAYHDSTEWNDYKKEAEAKLKANEKRINNLKLEIKKATKKYDAVYLKKVDRVEKKNAELHFKVDSYTINTDNDWEDFKKELNYELDELGKSIDKVTADKKR
jgi:hypothetical protein